MLTRLLKQLYEWLAPSDAIQQADLIFALAGRQSRKLFALELFWQGKANILLLSVGRFEIRRFARLSWPTKIDLVSLAASTPPPRRHYFVSLEGRSTGVELIHKGRFGTLSEIRALARWLELRPHVRSLLVVSSGPHLRRVRACCRALLPAGTQLSFISTPEDGYLTCDNWWRQPECRALVLKEVGKLFIYRLLLMGVARNPSAEAGCHEN